MKTIEDFAPQYVDYERHRKVEAHAREQFEARYPEPPKGNETGPISEIDKRYNWREWQLAKIKYVRFMIEKDREGRA